MTTTDNLFVHKLAVIYSQLVSVQALKAQFNYCSVSSFISLCSAIPEPKYTIVREPVDGDVPEFIVLETQLPGIVRHVKCTCCCIY